MEASGGVVTPGTDVRQREKEREEARATRRAGRAETGFVRW